GNDAARAKLGVKRRLSRECHRDRRNPLCAKIDVRRDLLRVDARRRRQGDREAEYSIHASSRSPQAFLAESEGFEPPSPCGLTDFKSAAFDRSANSPGLEKSLVRPHFSDSRGNSGQLG